MRPPIPTPERASPMMSHGNGWMGGWAGGGMWTWTVIVVVAVLLLVLAINKVSYKCRSPDLVPGEFGGRGN